MPVEESTGIAMWDENYAIHAGVFVTETGNELMPYFLINPFTYPGPWYSFDHATGDLLTLPRKTGCADLPFAESKAPQCGEDQTCVAFTQ